MTYDNLPPWAEDMQSIFEDKKELFSEDDQDEMNTLASKISNLMMSVDNMMSRMNEILEENLGTKYMEL